MVICGFHCIIVTQIITSVYWKMEYSQYQLHRHTFSAVTKALCLGSVVTILKFLIILIHDVSEVLWDNEAMGLELHLTCSLTSPACLSSCDSFFSTHYPVPAQCMTPPSVPSGDLGAGTRRVEARHIHSAPLCHMAGPCTPMRVCTCVTGFPMPEQKWYLVADF